MHQLNTFLLIALTFVYYLAAPISAEFNFEVGLRVHERVTEFIGAPTNVLDSISNLFINDYFSHDLRSPDRNDFLRFGDAMLKTYHYDMIYYGLEDGTFVGNYYPVRMATYREPGESGHDVVGDNATGTTGDMQKHYVGCVDKEGAEVPCQMSAGETFIECVDGCSPKTCTDEDSQESNTKWCPSYVEKKIPEGTQNIQRGFIPRSYYCIDEKGLPTQKPGTVSRYLNADLTNCYYEDGVTIVDRYLEGNYAFCGGGTNLCNTTFVGAFRSIKYDPRYRDWYKDTRALHKPNWSLPYVFFTNQEMGISYSLPIYRNEDGREVFSGVLSLDVKLKDIASFLTDNYQDTDTIVAIVEEAAPNFVIASSTGSSGAKKVLIYNDKKTCPSDANQDLCKAVRIPVNELSAQPFDKAVSTAFERHVEEGFPEAKLVPIEADDMTYISQTIPFVSESDGIDWRIMIMGPLEVQSQDTVKKGDAMFVIILFPAIAGFVVCSIFLALLIKNRKEREVVYSDWRFTGVFILACAFLNLACLSFVGENTDELCLLRMWLLHLCFVLALAPLLVKTYRMYLLIGTPSLRRRKISHTKTAMMMLPFVMIQLAILLIFTFVDPNKETTIIAQDGYDVIYRRVCAHETKAFFLVQVLYEGGLVLIGCFLAYKTRNLGEEFGEAKQLIIAMYNIALVGSAILITANVVEAYDGTIRGFITVSVCWTTCFSSGVFVLPRLLRMQANITRDRVIVTGLSSRPDT